MSLKEKMEAEWRSARLNNALTTAEWCVVLGELTRYFAFEHEDEPEEDLP